MKTIDGQALWHSLGAVHFREMSTFGALPDTTVQRLLAEGHVRQLDQGEVLYRAGDRVYSFFVVISGQLAMYSCADDQHAFSRHHTQGETIGFVAMIGLHERVATAVAAQETLVVEISSDQFLGLHISEPEAFGLLLLNLSREMARGIRQLNSIIVHMSMQQSTGKVD
ncbi:Crp/Fnr family transcriptional regulator [Marinobacterium sedimentorum]|uniref:Crp/Fnr family transcriptional regulator n=1 Tax=Marinobacterium sedimentorum TaxID=2927804 RepID=UPI0020C69258|nr:Crp/Fnr family transcriptional regulator [Marinobacterium sedimentorum]MCP8687052.1 Crp/Fnr family transcriptional regulator [Marinobacterium sedimentorum]